MTIYHTHHIVPRHMGGTDDPSNLIKLTVEEHAEAHRILYETHGKQEDYIAWKVLSGQMVNPELLYERAQLGGKWHAGKPKSEQQKQRMKEAWIERKARGVSEETRKKMSESAKIRANSPKYIERVRSEMTPEKRAKMFAARMRNKGLE